MTIKMACFCAELGEISVLGLYPDFCWDYSVRMQGCNLARLARLAHRVHLKQSVRGEDLA